MELIPFLKEIIFLEELWAILVLSKILNQHIHFQAWPWSIY
jgi:hypothetical protein